MGTLIRRVRAIPARDWPALLAAAIAAVAVEVGLRTTKLTRTARLLGIRLAGEGGRTTVMSAAPSRPWLPPRALRQFRSSVRVIRHWPFGDTCLRRALVVGQRLRRFNPTLQIGVAKIEGTLRAHAWLEIDGVSLDPGSSAFEPLTIMRNGPHNSAAINPNAAG